MSNDDLFGNTPQRVDRVPNLDGEGVSTIEGHETYGNLNIRSAGYAIEVIDKGGESQKIHVHCPTGNPIRGGLALEGGVAVVEIEQGPLRDPVLMSSIVLPITSDSGRELGQLRISMSGSVERPSNRLAGFSANTEGLAPDSLLKQIDHIVDTIEMESGTEIAGRLTARN